MDAKKTATIKLIETTSTRAVLEVRLPPKTQLRAIPHVVARIDELIEKLTQCPCNSGVELHIRDMLVDPAKAPINEQVGFTG